MRHLLTVIAILLAFACCTTEADRSRMCAELDSINQRNRNDQPFTMADVEPRITGTCPFYVANQIIGLSFSIV